MILCTPIDRSKTVLPDRGPPAGVHDGSVPGDMFAAGQWRIVGGVLTLVPAPTGYSFNPKDGHP